MFRKGMRVVYRGDYGTVGGSEFDEETRKYSRYVLLYGERWEILVDAKHLRPLTEGEWFLELVENDKHKWTDQHIGNVLRNLEPIDVTRPPKHKGIPLRPYRVKGVGQPELPDLAEIV